jgi:NAD(P)-dependent dehydrogenase (short-subunit alcohol dehydrogenase family)
MLVLINGVTGTIGAAVARALLARGHRVRGLGRSADRLPDALSSQLESFIAATSWYDASAHDLACAGVDAVVNASAALPHLMLDGQLLLLRAAERAGVAVFVAAAWNYNWTKVPLGYHEAYSHLIMFKEQAELSSPIKPIYVFTGVLAEYWFRSGAHMNNVPASAGWDPAGGRGAYSGDGSLRHQFTTVADAAEYTAELVVAPGAADGGCFEVMSFGADVWEMKDTYERVTGKAMELSRAGDLEAVPDMALAGRRAGEKNKYFDYIGKVYALPHVKRLANVPGCQGWCT